MKKSERMHPAAQTAKRARHFRRSNLFKDFAFSLLSLTLVVSSLSASTVPTIRIIIVKDASEAENIRAEIGKGKPFALLAKERSIDKSRDSYGEIAKASFEKLDAPLRDDALQLSEGEVSRVITLGDGRYALVLVVDMTFYRNGARAFRSGDFRTSETNLLKHVALNPDAVKARVLLGRIYESRKEYDKAEANYRDALRFDALSEEAYDRLGALYLRSGDIRQAKNVYDEGMLHLPGSRALKEGGEKAARQIARLDKKKSAAKEIADREQPETPTPEVKLPNTLPTRAGLSRNAEDKKLHIRIIVTRSESDAKDILAELKRGKSMALLAKERSIDENTRDAYGYLGEVALGTLDASLQQPIFQLKEGQTSGVIRMDSNRYAIAQVTDVSLYREGEKALIAGDSVTAEKKLLAYVETNPDAVKARTLLGKIYEDRNEFSKAIDMYKKAISFSPKTVLVYERLARDYLLLGEYKKAKDIYTEGLRQVPSSPEMEEGIEMADMLLIGERSRMP
jgi:parvulin-like peptidyl-prolyl isomerase